jgi:IMP dehydrogenase/GMP reductase
MKNIKPQFDFDDVLIVPKVKTHISSRYNGITLDNKNLPLFTAPMDTVVDTNNMFDFLSNGISVTLPRTIKKDEYHLVPAGVFVSMGFNDIDEELKTSLRNLQKEMCIVIDVANGHMQKLFDYCREIKRLRPDITLMIGNIGNPETYYWYAKNTDVNYIRVGIGNGGGCLTTKQSGVGYPMASLIYETSEVKKKFQKENPNKKAPAIVADGGMKDHSDIIKSLALGADYVMIGSIFNKALESCAQNYLYGVKINKRLAKFFFDKGYPVKKYFRGMSTKGAQKAMGKTSFKTSEGVVRYRRVEYHLDGWVENFEHYLRNAMSYSNAKTLDEFIGKVEICQITTRAYDRFNK